MDMWISIRVLLAKASVERRKERNLIVILHKYTMMQDASVGDVEWQEVPYIYLPSSLAY